MKRVITRFAPSPTGSLHIGGARTALFNYLYAKHYGGKFFIRIENTNEDNNSNAKEILDGLRWLGLCDNDSYNVTYQSYNIKHHQDTANFLVSQDRAYRDGGDSIRIKGGDISDDYALLRENGSPTYMLANVVDDRLQRVTHIIRGVDHIDNQKRQGVLWDAMGWDKPEYIHIGLVHKADGKKLSKSNGDRSVLDYRAMGIFPEALNNYMCHLGWSPIGLEDMDVMEEAIKLFDGTRLSKSPAKIDQKLLQFINKSHITFAANATVFERQNMIDCLQHLRGRRDKK